MNALDAMDGQGRLTVETARADNRVTVSISDTGPGIDPERQASLFELNLGRKGRRVGLGLGLPTSRRIVERHGGTLRLDRTGGDGSRFTISLPVSST